MGFAKFVSELKKSFSVCYVSEIILIRLISDPIGEGGETLLEWFGFRLAHQ